jgi:hypothetical protein
MLNGYKTYLAAIAALLIAISTAIQQYLNFQVIDYAAVISAFIALALIFLRQGIKKEGVK